MKRRLAVLAIATVVVAAGIAPTAGRAAMAGTPGTAPAGHWGNAQRVPGMAALNPDGNAGVESISCDRPGECAAGGFTVGDSQTHDHLFHDVLAMERGGTWQQARRVYGTDPTVESSLINSVSCAHGSCAAGGWFTRSDGDEHAFVVVADEAKGTIGIPVEVPGTSLTSGGNASVLAVSCADVGACAAGGHSVTKDGDEEPFVVDETGGGWGTARSLENMDTLNKAGRGIVTAISCGAPGHCVAAGTYEDDQRIIHAFEAEEASGNWGPAQPLPGMDTLTTGESEPMSVSCSGPGNCAIAGFYDSSDFTRRQAFVIDERGGLWGSAQQVPGTAARNTNHFATVNSVSCTSAGECAAVGYYSTPDGRHQFVTEERGGTWQPSIRDLTHKGSPGDGFGVEANAVSCGSPGNCVVTGEFADAENGSHLFTLNEVNGSWAKVLELPGSAKLNTEKFGRLLTVSCASAGNCAVGGFYEDAKGDTQGLVADESSVTATHLSLSAPRVWYGHEQDEKISVSVTSRTGGTPGGQVTVATRHGTLCVITLANGKGNCGLAAKKLPVGSYAATARYAGGHTYDGSTSGVKPLTVTPPTGHWGHAHTVGGLNNANAGGVADVSSVSCGSPGNCVAVGTFRSSDHNSHSFLAEERGGTWGQPGGLLPLMVTTLDSVSCGDADNCVAIGHEIDSAPHPFFDVKAHGVWGGAAPLDANGVRGEPISVSCVPGSPGNCAIGGWVNDTQGLAQPFTKGENGGTWAPLQQVTALENINAGTDAQVNSVSCRAPGSCTAAGFVRTSDGSYRPFITEESGGQWTFGFPIPELSRITTNSAQATVVSCATADDCALAGHYTDGHGHQQVFVIDKVNGDWILPQPVQGLANLNVGGFAEVTGISCGSPGNCVVTGDYEPDTHNSTAGFVAEEKNGRWQPARPVVGTDTSTFGTPIGSADAVSCVSAGNCVVGGSISAGNGDLQAAVLSEVNGGWGTPTVVPGMAALRDRSADVNAVSCASVGNCAIGGIYQDSHGDLQAFIADESTATSTSLKLSAAKIRFGHEQSERLSVKVKARTGGTPSGQVTVLASGTKLCVIALAKGTGSCTLPARKLRPGTYRLTGVYGGDRHYDGSAYPAKTLTVTR